MGAICGYVSKKTFKENTLTPMIEALRRRGKHNKKYENSNFGIAILSDSEITEEYKSEDTIFVTIDGEIDNREEICNLLNITFSTDIQLIKELYKKYGEEFVYKVEGFCAVIVYDKEKEILIMMRDKMGVKPIYYFINDNSICFSSELKGIMQFPEFEKKINEEALSMYFRFCFINPPETIYQNTYKLYHGEYIKWEKGNLEKIIYWDEVEKYNINSSNSKLISNFEEAKKALKNNMLEYLKNTIEKHPNFGIFLSGGIDSSLVTSMCSSICKEPVNTFSIGFYEEERNEAEKAKKIANYLQTNHHEIYIDEQKMLDTIRKIPEYYDEPFADASEIPTIILNEYAAEYKIDTVITGDGADQLYCGSNIYDKLNDVQKAYKVLNPFNKDIKILKKILRKRHLKIIFNNANTKYQSQIDIVSRENEFEGLFPDNGKKRFDFEDKIATDSWQVRRMQIDVNTFVPNRINTKVDRAGAKNGIQLKTPFQNSSFVELSSNIPQKYKYYKRNKKYILKKILYDYVPEELLSNEKKGFGIPMKKWLTTYLKEDLQKVSNKDFIEKQGIFNYEKLTEMINYMDNPKSPQRLPQIIWNFYMFQLWYIEYIQE